MDAVIAQTLNHFYTLIYTQAVAFNLTFFPSPATASQALSSVCTTIYNYSPENLQLYYDKFVSLPVQSNIIPVFLALFVLYTLFSIILMTVRGIMRMVYNFIRFSLMVMMIVVLLYITREYLDQGAPALYSMFEAWIQGTKSSVPPFVVQSQ
ncbi:hypothetical protein BC940DRAFT_310491 [Gongronella butleri]|nr:hypothetical protein BC940DRAFT_310491 [Gongronella butleri]